MLSAALPFLEVELTDLPAPALVHLGSLRVAGTGYCTILDVSYTAGNAKEEEKSEEELEKLKEEKREVDKEIRELEDRLELLMQENARNQRKQEMADYYMSNMWGAAPGNCAQKTPPQNTSSTPVIAAKLEDMDRVLDWWTEKAVKTDAEHIRLDTEGKRIKASIEELRRQPITAPQLLPSSPGKIIINLDVSRLAPIELEVNYMNKEARWTPAYDIRVNTQTNTISCTYYANVMQSTGEDWKGVSLTLSTAEPTARSTPPMLLSRSVSFKKPEKQHHSYAMAEAGNSLKASHRKSHPRCITFSASSTTDQGALMQNMPMSHTQRGFVPAAATAVAKVEGGGGGVGAVSFLVKQPAFVESNTRSKKLTIGVLKLSAEVVHYIVPSKEPAAYLNAKATNDTEYLLLASQEVSIFFDNTFVTKTKLGNVSPGESFVTSLGVDHTVKVRFAPPRKTSKTVGMIGKSNHVTHIFNTTVTNTKNVPVTCVLVDTVPRSDDELIKVIIKHPSNDITQSSTALDIEELKSAVVQAYMGRGEEENAPSPASSSHDPVSTAVQVTAGLPVDMKTSLLGAVKNDLNHVAWLAKVAPQDDVQIPLEYAISWPLDKEVMFSTR